MRTNELILYKNMEYEELLLDMTFLMEHYDNEYYNQEDLKDYSVLGIEKYTLFVDKNSPEFRRKILNAYYSESIGVRCSDDYSFVKSNSKKFPFATWHKTL